MLLHSDVLRQLYALYISGFLLISWLCAVSQAQGRTTITPDGTMGTVVTQRGSLYNIRGGMRPGDGPNLFHSFDQFSVGTDDTARFSGPTGIENILSRVTGAQQSEIDGRLQSTIPGANLYLLNPNGVVFGPRATLDVGGSFHVSTADYLRFADGATFSAHLGTKSTLTVASPAAFGFLGTTPAPIAILESSLSVPPSASLSLVGGDIRIVGGRVTPFDPPTLVAPAGKITIASVASAGEVVARHAGSLPEWKVASFDRLGRINVQQGALLDTSGNGGGTVHIQGERLRVDNARISSNTVGARDGAAVGIDFKLTENVILTQRSSITSDTTSTGAAGELRIVTGSFRMDDTSALGSLSFQAGDAGMVTVTASRITLAGGAQIGNATLGLGQGSTVTVTATESLTISGILPDGSFASGILANTNNPEGKAGTAGTIIVTAPRITLTDGAQIGSSTFGPGQGGTVRVIATEQLILSGTVTTPAGTFSSGIFANAERREGEAGAAGVVIVASPRITLTDGAQISSDTLGPGNGGTVRVTATESLTLASSSLIGADTHKPEGAAGAAGGVIVTAPRITLADGAQIGSGTFGPGQGGTVRVTATEQLILSGTVTTPAGTFPSSIHASSSKPEGAAGAAGGVIVTAPHITLTDGAQISSGTLGPGNGGTVRVTATESLNLASSSLISANTHRPEGAAGAAGTIIVTAPHITLTDGSQIGSGTFGPGQGGMVRVTATEQLILSGTVTTPAGTFPSGIYASSNKPEGAAGAAGTIIVTAPRITLTDGAEIGSGTFGPGQGGTVRVTATESLNLASSSLISANTYRPEGAAGAAGTIIVTAPRITLTDGAVIGSGTFGPGQGGTVRVTATEQLILSGTVTTPAGTLPSGILASTLGQGADAGDAGTVEVTARNLTVTDGAQITSGTFGAGQGGTVTVTGADTISMTGSNSGVFTTARASGRGGDIVLQAHILELTEEARISAESFGASNAGNIRIAAQEAALRSGSSVTTTVEQGEASGGNILIGGTLTEDGVITEGVETFTLDGSKITANTDTGSGANITIGVQRLMLNDASAITADTGAGTGGNLRVAGAMTADGTINARADTIVLRESELTANAGSGTGGRIDIITEAFLADPASVIDASSQAGGIDGVVNVEAVVSNLSEIVTTLSPDFAQAAELLRNRCAAQLQEGTVSSLVARGHASVPATPEGLLPSRLYQLSPISALPYKSEQQPAETAAPHQEMLAVDPLRRPQIINRSFPAHVPVALKCN